MLIGTGVDLIEVERIARSIERFGERFLRRVYTDHEIAYCSRKRINAESFAARFAAKEAGAKARASAGGSRGMSSRSRAARANGRFSNCGAGLLCWPKNSACAQSRFPSPTPVAWRWRR
jgi:hypothetical protein